MSGKLRLAWIEALAHDMRRDLQQMRPPVTVLVSGYDSPEGPAFDRDGNLYFVNWLSSSIVRLTPEGDTSEFFNTGGIPAGLAFHRDGSLYVADEGDDIHGVLRVTDGQATILVNEYEGQALNGANDLVFDGNGVLYFSDPWRSSAENPVGGFYRLFPDGRLDQIDHGLAFPNGVALSADGAAVYVAHFGGGKVAVFDPSGKMIQEISVPGAKVTNVAFGGPDRRTLVITEVETASLYQTRVDVPGLELYRMSERC